VLKLPNRGRYALIALLDVVLFGNEKPAQTREIALRQRIPLRFLEQIFQDLKRAGLVQGKRGPGGGFVLSRPAVDIRVGDVLRAACGPIEIAPTEKSARTRSSERAERGRELERLADRALTDVGARVEQCFDELTLEELSQRGRDAGIGARHTPARAVRYAI